MIYSKLKHVQGRIQDFKLGGHTLKKSHRAEGGAKILGVFRVKNHDFTQKNHIFSNFRGGAHAGCIPPWIRPWCIFVLCWSEYQYIRERLQGRIQDFKLGRGAYLKKSRRAEGGAKIVEGISCEKSLFYAKKSYFFQF